MGGGLVMAIMDACGFGIFRESFDDQNGPWKLGAPLAVDFRGQKLPLTADDLAVNRAVAARFSVDEIVQRKAGPLATQLAAARHASGLATGARLAVLEFRNYAQDIPVENVRFLTDVVRKAALHGAPDLEIMTRENLVVLLQASGKDLASCEGECEVDTGRRIGADAIISGDLQKFGSRYKLSLRLHETAQGRLLGATVLSGKALDELDAGADKAAAALIDGVK
jgi:hypothetical protein